MKKLVFNFKSKDTKKIKISKNILGGKGANLAEMGRLGYPVPSGFTISTTSPGRSKCSLPTVLFVLTSIALIKLSPKSECNLYAKSKAVDFGGSKKQSGRMFPSESANLFTPPGKIGIYFKISNFSMLCPIFFSPQ